MKMFEIASGTMVGRDHRSAGKNNQDAICVLEDLETAIAIVCDGCSSGKYAEIGSLLGSRFIGVELLKILNASDCKTEVEAEFILERARQNVLAQLRVLAMSLGGSFSQTVKDYFLFTVVGAALTQQSTFIFSIGDGFINLNGETLQIGPFPDNEPPYLGYNLTGSPVTDGRPELLKFTIHKFVPTEEVQFLLIGTDGVKDLISAEKKKIPGRDEEVGPLSQFWQEDRNFKNPDIVRRRLAIANQEITRLDQKKSAVEKELGLLPDDTTLVAIRRKKESKEAG